MAPDIPTTDEAGLPGFYFSVWSGLWVPHGTPAPIVAKLVGAVREALADATVRKRFDAMAIEIPAAGHARPGPARGAPEGRDRDLVADDQDDEHQGGVRAGNPQVPAQIGVGTRSGPYFFARPGRADDFSHVLHGQRLVPGRFQ